MKLRPVKKKEKKVSGFKNTRRFRYEPFSAGKHAHLTKPALVFIMHSKTKNIA